MLLVSDSMSYFFISEDIEGASLVIKTVYVETRMINQVLSLVLHMSALDTTRGTNLMSVVSIF
jgi:hypothetical protein